MEKGTFFPAKKKKKKNTKACLEKSINTLLETNYNYHMVNKKEQQLRNGS